MTDKPADKIPHSLFGAGSPASRDGEIFNLPAGWRDVLSEELHAPYFQQLADFVETERKSHEVFPPSKDIYNALRLTSLAQVRVLLLGQDPYHDTGQAQGLCFSVPDGIRPPPSLVNIFKELKTDLNMEKPKHGDLTSWAKQGVLLLNAVLTVRAHKPNSHKDKGWEKFTDAIIRKVSEKPEAVVFVLWGGYAQKKEKLIDVGRHIVIKSAHPSPLSANNGFFGSRPFSKINEALSKVGSTPIDWKLD